MGPSSGHTAWTIRGACQDLAARQRHPGYASRPGPALHWPRPRQQQSQRWALEWTGLDRTAAAPSPRCAALTFPAERRALRMAGPMPPATHPCLVPAAGAEAAVVKGAGSTPHPAAVAAARPQQRPRSGFRSFRNSVWGGSAAAPGAGLWPRESLGSGSLLAALPGSVLRFPSLTRLGVETMLFSTMMKINFKTTLLPVSQ